MKVLAVPLAAMLAGAAAPPVGDVYVLAGQSNMSGRGALADLSDGERAADPRILLYGNDGRWRDAADPLDDAASQIDPVSTDRQAAVGPGLFFARALLGKGVRTPLALLPCAKGGSSIARWVPGSGRDTLYGSCLARTQELKQSIAGLLWYQGESDAEKASEPAEAWPRRFREIVTRYRVDVGQPDLPVVFVQLSDKPKKNGERFPSWHRMQQLQAGFSMHCVAMVKATGLTRNDDELHLATAGQRVLGRRLAKAMLRLKKEGCR